MDVSQDGVVDIAELSDFLQERHAMITTVTNVRTYINVIANQDDLAALESSTDGRQDSAYGESENPVTTNVPEYVTGVEQEDLYGELEPITDVNEEDAYGESEDNTDAKQEYAYGESEENTGAKQEYAYGESEDNTDSKKKTHRVNHKITLMQKKKMHRVNHKITLK